MRSKDFWRPRKLHQLALLLGLVATLALLIAACGGSSSEGGSTGEETTTTSTESEGGEASGGSASLEKAEEELAPYTTTKSEYEGPTTGPKTEAGKEIVFVSYDQKNAALQAWQKAVEKAAGIVGWKVKVLDGQGTTQGQQSALNQALALKPDGVVLGAMPTPNQSFYKNFAAAGIPLVGVTSAAGVGPFEDINIYYNVNQDPEELGRVMGNWMVVDSEGKARVVLITDPSFQILTLKTAGMKESFDACEECEMLLETVVKIEDAANRLGTLTTSWVQQYGVEPPFYIAQGSDYWTEFEIPALRAAGVEQGQVTISGMDGAPIVYERVRNGDEYQGVTMPIPYSQQGFEVIDEMNRAFHEEPPAEVKSPVMVLDSENAEPEPTNEYEPENEFEEHYSELWKTGKTG